VIKLAGRALWFVVYTTAVKLEALVAGINGNTDRTNGLNSKRKSTLRPSSDVFE